MHQVIINKLGPIGHVEISCRSFMVFTGSQASGKSTIAKTIYYFRTVKDDILSLMIKRAANFDNSKNERLYKAFEAELREKFMRIFGSSWGMDNDKNNEYHYSETTYIRVFLKEETKYSAPNYLWIDYSDDIKHLLIQSDNARFDYPSAIQSEEKSVIKAKLCDLFSDHFEGIYIPAGRSMITLLATQLNYIYSTMDDAQKRTIDFCTRSYLERILKIRPEFENGLSGLMHENPKKAKENSKTLEAVSSIISHILKGTYRYNNGDERLELPDGHYVKINFMSSGQQEVVWILNLIFYQLLQNQPAFFVIEEPESHLFPEAQKYISELIALVNKTGDDVLVTTHSPYVLGSFNNLLYANQLTCDAESVSNVINSNYHIKNDLFDAWFVEHGTAHNAMDSELHLINNDLIDGISKVINADYDRLFDIQLKNEEERD